MTTTPDTPSVPPAMRDNELMGAFFGSGDLTEAHAKARGQIEELAEELRVAILHVPPKALLGFLWGQLLMGQIHKSEPSEEVEGTEEARSGLDDLVFALEYVHAVLSGHAENLEALPDQDAAVHQVLSLAVELRAQTMLYCLIAARLVPEGQFGDETGMLAMQAMTSWVTIRGHRYQALEEEFFSFMLMPHHDALREAYGIGAQEIARGIQAAVDSTRYGHMGAANLIGAEAEAAYKLAENEGLELGEAIEKLYADDPEKRAGVSAALSRMFFGGICDVGVASALPEALLQDLSYSRGEEKEFFAKGQLSGTPLRRMPGRVRPLVTLDGAHYACDPNFMRDSAYRAIQWGLLRRLPEYKHEWEQRQTELTEAAFLQILHKQLAGAEVFTSVYYPSPDTGEWVENDVLVLLNDVLLQVEIKAGVMPMHPPEEHFEKHVRTIQALVIKAKTQSDRFLRYAASADEVPLYKLENGRHVEVARLHLRRYRVVLPIGLTVEAFTPFSSMCKRLPEMAPILGKYPFISMSIDDLFVLTRFLHTSGELTHYLSVRQAVAAQSSVVLFDELDHLGAYIKKNRADQFYAEKIKEGATWVADVGTCEAVDAYFANPDWEKTPPPAQTFPAPLDELLVSFDTVRGPRYLRADFLVRDFGADSRKELASKLEMLRPSLQQHPVRWFMLGGDAEPVLVWLQQADYVDFASVHVTKAEAVCLAVKSRTCKVLVVYVAPDGKFAGGWVTEVTAPKEGDVYYAERLAESRKMASRISPLTAAG